MLVFGWRTSTFSSVWKQQQFQYAYLYTSLAFCAKEYMYLLCVAAKCDLLTWYKMFSFTTWRFKGHVTAVSNTRGEIKWTECDLFAGTPRCCSVTVRVSLKISNCISCNGLFVLKCCLLSMCILKYLGTEPTFRFSEKLNQYSKHLL